MMGMGVLATAARRAPHASAAARCSATPGMLSISCDYRCRSFSVKATPKQVKPLDSKRIIETNIVEGAENLVMRWVGRGSAMQMYCTVMFAGKLIYEADAASNIYEVWATSGALASASACVFFGAKLFCDKIVTDVAACRNFGEKDEFVRLTIQGALAKYALHVSLEDIQLIQHQAPSVYKFKVGDRSFSLDISNGKCVNRKALESILGGKPLVTRKVKQPKKRQA